MKTLNKTASLLLAGSLANAIKFPAHATDHIDIGVSLREAKSLHKIVSYHLPENLSSGISINLSQGYIFPRETVDDNEIYSKRSSFFQLPAEKYTEDTKTYNGAITRWLLGNNFAPSKIKIIHLN